jgi:glycolate oxidase FAD binding subunit
MPNDGPLAPRDAADVCEAVASAAAAGEPIEIVGHGSKRAIGRPVQAARSLDLSALSGITLYEPEELVLAARAGTPLAEIEELLAARGQALAFEPMDYGPLLGGSPGRGTVGGLVAANLSGPRRVKAGAARDHVLGVAAVSGRGEAFKAGGRVVKNVTGYDLARGLSGSWGTLAVMTEVTLKVLPSPETEATVVLAGLDGEAAGRAMRAAMAAPVDVSGAAHLPAAPAKAAGPLAGLGRAATLIRLEGIAASVDERAARLTRLLADFGPIERLVAATSAAVWRAVRDVAPLAEEPARIVWRVSVAPTAGPGLVAAVERRLAAEAVLDWAGGLVWLALADPGDDGGAALVRAAVAAAGGGHATLIRAPADVRTRVAVFEPQPPPLAALSARLKAAFDPNGVLNPGRMG